MRIVRHGDGIDGPPPGASFTGDVLISSLLRDGETAVSRVTFVAGARTYWHTHQHGQILLVTAGRGWVGGADGTQHRIEQGDLVWTGPGERHWHGAVPASDMTHLAVSLGPTTWLDEVVDGPTRS